MTALPSEIAPMWNRLFALRDREELIAAVFTQLVSDFHRAGCTLPFGQDLPPEDWNMHLGQYLASLSSQTIDRLLYIVDIPEKLAIHIALSDNRIPELANAILYREMVKIYYKISFSS
jgi:hypothetical protein